MVHAQDSLQFHLSALRSLDSERKQEEFEANRLAEAVRLGLTRFAEQVFSAIESASRASLESARKAREAAERDARARAKAEAARAAVVDQLERERALLGSEMEIRAALASETRPWGIVVVVGLLLAVLAGLGLWGHGRQSQVDARLRDYASRRAAIAQRVDQSLNQLDARSMAVDESGQRALAARAEADAQAAREAAARAQAERLAAIAKAQEAERKRLAVEQARRERERLEQARRAEWERLNSAQCAADPLCGVR